MKDLTEILSEGAFDYAEGGLDLGAGVEKDSTANFLSTYGKGNYKVLYLKDGSCKITGRLLISKCPDEAIYIKCKEFKGRLTIENCPNLKSLKNGLFDKMYVFKGSIAINQCPSLESLEGLPSMIDGDLDITNCKKLKDFGSVESVLGSVMWMNNGKRYTEDQIKSKLSVIQEIMCSEEDVEANIEESLVNESFNNPWLQKLAAQLKKYPYDASRSWENPKLYNLKMDDLFYNVGSGRRVLSEISGDEVLVFNPRNPDEKKEMDKIIYTTYSARSDASGFIADLMLVFDKKLNAFTWGVGYRGKVRGNQSEMVKYFKLPNSENDRHEPDMIYKTDVRRMFDNLAANEIVIAIGKFGGTGVSARWDVMSNRDKARQGMIRPGDAEQYQRVFHKEKCRHKQIF